MKHPWRAVNQLGTIFWCMDCGCLKTTLFVGWVQPGCLPQDYEPACPGKPVFSKPRIALDEIDLEEISEFFESAIEPNAT